MGKSRASIRELLTHTGLARLSIDAPYLDGTQGPLHQHMSDDGISPWYLTAVPAVLAQVEDIPAQTSVVWQVLTELLSAGQHASLS